MNIERKIEVKNLKQEKKELIKQLGISMLVFKKRMPKLPIKDKNYFLAGNKRHYRNAGHENLSLKEQVEYLKDLLKAREENKEMFDLLMKEFKEKQEKKNA